MKRTIFTPILAAASGLALALSAPAAAQESDQLREMGEAMAAMFMSEPLNEEQQARLPAAQKIIDIMMPKGFYAQMMGEMMGTALEPMMAMMSGATGADLVLSTRLNVAPDALEKLSDEERVAIATMLDPAFPERGPLVQGMMNDIMLEMAIAIEPGFREGMANAYAVRFDAAQLADIESFFATPSGKIFARENLKLMADPQVISASMQAMPAMMEQFADLDKQLEEAMGALPAARDLGDLELAEREQLAELLGADVKALTKLINPPAAQSDEF